jgi:homeobox protein cut-like
MDELIQERVQAKQNELTAEYDERLRNYEERWVR